MPGGLKLNDYLQGLRKSLPDWHHELKIDLASEILEEFKSRSEGRAPSLAVEIGAGWDLLMPLAIKHLGCQSIHCLDIHPHLDKARIRQSLDRLSLRKIGPGSESFPTNAKLSDLVAYLRTNHGLSYDAPADARSTAFDDNSVDLVYTYHVLEHVPETAIGEIHRESLRILKPGGLAIHFIDLQDHWAYSGSGQSIHGFLAHDPLCWKFLNPPIHFQNRLRSTDHIHLFRKSGFLNFHSKVDEATPEQLSRLEQPGSIHPSQRRNLSLEEIGAREIRLIGIKTSL